MANKELSAGEKSELLYGDSVNADLCNQLADGYAAAQRFCEAADFYNRAGNSDALRKLADLAVTEGDAFLLKQMERALGSPFDVDRWRALAEAAQANGKTSHVDTARQRCDDTDTDDE